MTAERFVSDNLNDGTSEIEFYGEEAHHISRVVRKRPGERIEILNGQGMIARAEIIEHAGRTVRARILSREIIPKRLPVLELAVGIIKKESIMGDVIRTATELGVARIVPLKSRYAGKWQSTPRESNRTARWIRIIRGAAKQCRQPWFPELAIPMTPEAYLDHCHLRESPLFVGIGPGEITDELPFGEDVDEAERLSVLIGPEGGWSGEEQLLFRKFNCRGIQLGQLTFTTQVAVAACLTAIQIKLNLI